MRHERGIVVGKRGWNLGLPSPFSDVIMIDVAMLKEKKIQRITVLHVNFGGAIVSGYNTSNY